MLTHNLLLCYEDRLEKLHAVTNQAEEQRRDRRTTEVSAPAARQGTPRSTLVVQARRATQCSVKFIRWLRHSLRAQLTEATAVLHLKLL